MERGNGWNTVRSLARGLAAAVGLTAVGMALLAVMVVYARLSDGTLLSLNQVLKLACIFTGAWTAVGAGGRRGFALGAAVGLIYIALGYGLCALGGEMIVSGPMLAMEFALGAGLGAVSGALAANFPARKGKRRRPAHA